MEEARSNPELELSTPRKTPKITAMMIIIFITKTRIKRAEDSCLLSQTATIPFGLAFKGVPGRKSAKKMVNYRPIKLQRTSLLRTTLQVLNDRNA